MNNSAQLNNKLMQQNPAMIFTQSSMKSEVLQESWSKQNSRKSQITPMSKEGDRSKSKKPRNNLMIIPSSSQATMNQNLFNNIQNNTVTVLSQQQTYEKSFDEQLQETSEINENQQNKIPKNKNLVDTTYQTNKSQDKRLKKLASKQNKKAILKDDPNEAVKEVLKQILDEENKKSSIGSIAHMGLAFGGISQIPKFTKDIIRQEILHEKVQNHNNSASQSVSGFSSSVTTASTNKNSKSTNMSRRQNSFFKKEKEQPHNQEQNERGVKVINERLFESSSNETLKLPKVQQINQMKSSKIRSAHANHIERESNEKQLLLVLQNSNSKQSQDKDNQSQNTSNNKSLISSTNKKAKQKQASQNNDPQEFLPRTGIDQVFMKSNITFIRAHKEFEAINEASLYNKPLIEEYKIKELSRFEYELQLKTDHPNTNNYTQWYFFKVSNTRRFRTYQFHFTNFIKPDSSYNEGMKPLIYSKKESESRQTGWIRAGEDIAYYQTQKKPGQSNVGLNMTAQQLYTLSFKIQFKYDNDEIYFAYCYPYTYSDCQKFLTKKCTYANRDKIRRALLCKTLAVPMLNPDGVIVGNYRCSLSGQDLNRQWISPNPRSHPEIHGVKQMMRKTIESRDIFLYCDFHGHSRSKNAFMYGCKNDNSKDKKLKERVFPLMFSKLSDQFSFEGCSFNIQKQKESTARVVIWREYQLINSFTLECSFCGPNKGLYKDCHFTTTMLLDLGKYFCLTLNEYSDKDQSKAKQAFRELECLFNKSQSNNLTGPAQAALLEDYDKFNQQPHQSIQTAKTENQLFVRSEGLKPTTAQQQIEKQANQDSKSKPSYIRSKYAGIKKVRSKNSNNVVSSGTDKNKEEKDEQSERETSNQKKLSSNFTKNSGSLINANQIGGASSYIGGRSRSTTHGMQIHNLQQLADKSNPIKQ
eukprot:403364056